MQNHGTGVKFEQADLAGQRELLPETSYPRLLLKPVMWGKGWQSGDHALLYDMLWEEDKD